MKIRIPEKHRGIHWSNTDLNILREMYNNGVVISRISDKTGRTVDAVQKKIKDLSLSNRRNDWTEKEENNISLMARKNKIIEDFLDTRPDLKREVS